MALPIVLGHLTTFESDVYVLWRSPMGYSIEAPVFNLTEREPMIPIG